MREVIERLAAWGEHPERIVTHRFSLAEAAPAYQLADQGVSGKVCLVW